MRLSCFSFLLLVALSVTALANDHPACSEDATCEHGSRIKCSQCDEGTLACTKLGLTVLCPRFGPAFVENITTVDLQNNEIASFSNFPNKTRIVKLLMGHNRLTGLTVYKDQLSRFPHALYLDFSSNRLEYLDEDTFEKTPALVELFLKNTSLSTLPSDIFKHTKALKSVDLSWNNFTEFPVDIFQPHNRIITLNLNDNPISDLNADHFKNLQNLEYLYVENTNLVKIDRFTFASLIHLREISLDHNVHLIDIDEDAFGLRTMRPGAAAVALEHVSVRGCNLRQLHEQTVNIRGLKQLGLTNNPWQCVCELKWMANRNIWEQMAGKDVIIQEIGKVKCRDLDNYDRPIISLSSEQLCGKIEPLRRPSANAAAMTVLLISMVVLAIGVILALIGFRRFAKKTNHPHVTNGHPYRAIYNNARVVDDTDEFAEDRQLSKDPFEL